MNKKSFQSIHFPIRIINYATYVLERISQEEKEEILAQKLAVDLLDLCRDEINDIKTLEEWLS